MHQQPGTHAATTHRYRGTDPANRCRACGHRIGKGSMMTTVRWWSDLHHPEQLKTERYHADCAPPFDAARVVLYHPGFEWYEEHSIHTGKVEHIQLKPCVAHQVVDTVTARPLRYLQKMLSGFACYATRDDDDGWTVVTRGCGAGSTRRTRYWHQSDARKHMKRWYTRRFKFADIRTPATEQEV
jgi:hypothetical protein